MREDQRLQQASELTVQDTLNLAALPSEWRTEMYQATLEGDLDWMTTLIEQVRESNAALADVLTELASSFDHGTILQSIQRAAETE